MYNNEIILQLKIYVIYAIHICKFICDISLSNRILYRNCKSIFNNHWKWV